MALSNVLERRPRSSSFASNTTAQAAMTGSPPAKCTRAVSIDIPRVPAFEGTPHPMPPLRTAMRSTDGMSRQRSSRLSVRIQESPQSVIIVPARPETPPALPTRLMKKISGSFARSGRGSMGPIRR